MQLITGTGQTSRCHTARLAGVKHYIGVKRDAAAKVRFS